MKPDDARNRFAVWREEAGDWWSEDAHLRSLAAFHRIEDPASLRAFAGICAQQIEPLVRENNRDENLPRLRRYDDHGTRIEAIDHHPNYHAIGRLAYRSGVMSLYGEVGRERDAAARLYLFAQNGEAGHACPMACTAGLIKVLRHAGNPRPDWMARLVDPDYDHHYRGAQFLTEVQGGSDVGANAVAATHLDDGTARLTGEKWFCSVIDADLFLVTARPIGAGDGTAGLQGYVVPRRLDAGGVNGFRIRRLKYKLGTRSMASAEVDFDEAWALPVANFRTVLHEVIDTSRLLNAVCCAAIHERAYREAATYAANRMAFGQPIAVFPQITRQLADLRVDAYAARGLTFALANIADRAALGVATAEELGAYRMLVNLNKLWTSLSCTASVRVAIEVLGGNGAIEEFSALPRLMRDAVVLEAWEGGHNVLCSQVIRDCQRGALHEPMFAWLAAQGGATDALDRVQAAWNKHVVEEPGAAPWYIRDLCAMLRPVAQAACLIAESRQPASDPRLPVVIAHLLRSDAAADQLPTARSFDLARAVVARSSDA